MAIVIHSDLDYPTIVQLWDYDKNGTQAEMNGKIKHLDSDVHHRAIMRLLRQMLTTLFKELCQIGRIEITHSQNSIDTGKKS